MRNSVVLLFLLGFIASACAVVAEYSVVVEESGNSNIILTVSGKGSTSVSLPDSYSNLRVRGGSYDKKDSTITFEVFTAVDKRIITFSTSDYTRRVGGKYVFELPLIRASATEVGLSLPSSARDVDTDPDAFKSHGRYLWNFLSEQDEVRIEYSLPGMTSTTSSTTTTTSTTTPVIVTLPPTTDNTTDNKEEPGFIEEVLGSDGFNVIGITVFLVALILVASLIAVLLIKK